MKGRGSKEEKIREKLKGFIKHGFKIEGQSGGDQVFGYCPFSKKRKKFYINTKTLLWDSKIAGLSGNFFAFLTYIHKMYQENITEEDLQELSDNRNIPVSELKKYKIGISDNSEYCIPVFDEKAKIVDLRMYKLGQRLMSTPTCKTGLLGLDALAKANYRDPIYLCEGEWDCISMSWLLRKLKEPGTVVGSPGANTFKEPWTQFFKSRKVIVMYDNDSAGEEGEHKVLKTLGNSVKEFRFLHWPDKYEQGFDTRDFIGLEAITNKRPKRCFSELSKMFKNIPRKSCPEADVIESIKNPKPKIDKKMNWVTATEIIGSYLKMKNLDHFLISCAVILSNHIPGDPIWIFVVASPGEGKSELLSSFKYCDEVYITSSMTPNSLISGCITRPGEPEPSLLPYLDGKTLIIKDMSAIQTMNKMDRDALLGILRDAYDGEAGKVFGTGAKKKFKSKFSMLCGTTPSIYELDTEFSSLGERFLKFFMGSYLDHIDQYEVVARAMSNVGKEDDMREKIAAAMYSFVENLKEHMAKPDYTPPEITEKTLKRLGYLAIWIARMKGVVSRDKFQRNIITTKAFSEIGTRTGKQIKRLMLCMPTVILNGKESETEYNLIKKIALDSVSAQREDVFRTVFLECPTKDDWMDTTLISKKTGYSYSSVSRVLEDLIALGIIDRIGNRIPFKYTVSDFMRKYTKGAELYQDDITKDRITRAKYIEEVRSKLKSRNKPKLKKKGKKNDK